MCKEISYKTAEGDLKIIYNSTDFRIKKELRFMKKLTTHIPEDYTILSCEKRNKFIFYRDNDLIILSIEGF